MDTLGVLLRIHLVRFGIVAAFCTLLQQVFMLTLIDWGVDDIAANGIAFGMSAQVNFLLSITFTFRDRGIVWSLRLIRTHWLPFNSTALCALAVNEVAFAVCRQLSLGYVLASLAGTFTGACVSFTVNNMATFASPKEPVMTDMHTEPATHNIHPAVVSRLQQEGISFFMPAHNEAENLKKVVPSVAEYFSQIGCSFTIIVVNDGSTDNTVEVVNNLSRRYPGRVVLAQHDVNKGYGAGLRTGIDTALKTTHGLIAFFDADNQFYIEDFELLLARLIQEESHLSIGIRTQRADSIVRRLMGRGWHHLSQRILDYRAKDVDCGFKLFSRHMLEKIAPQLCGDHAVISPELLIRAQKAGFRMSEVSVRHRAREAGEQSGARLKVVFESLRQLFELRRAIRLEG